MRELAQEEALKDLVIAAYIPPAYQERIHAAAVWDDAAGEWAVRGMQFAGNEVRELRDAAAARAAHAEAAARKRQGAPLLR